MEGAKLEGETGISAFIVNFRHGPKTQKNNELVIEIPGVQSSAKAAAYIGRKIIVEIGSEKKRQIIGKIVSTHGNRGRLLARFRKGIPGQALARRVIIF